MRTRTSDLELRPLDHLLSAVSAGVAVYAAALSLASEHNGSFFIAILIAGTAVSAFVVSKLSHSKIIQFDSAAYTIAALGSVLAIGTLNRLMPDPIYDGNLTTSGAMCWMLALGSFLIWRDQTMLFQAVPGVALFGLVGCYDTFKASVIYFFVFLVCEAILLARAHGRAMLRQARSSSSERLLPAGTAGSEALEMAAMRRGPWRWMAGPEFALASAVTIVLVSAVGAPILRQSASGFSGLVRYAPPISPLAASPVATMTPSGTRVGTGPNTVRNTPMVRAEMPWPMYLRGFAYGLYDRGMWMPRQPFYARAMGAPSPQSVTLDSISDKREFPFKIELLEPSPISPVPGEVIQTTPDSQNAYRRNYGSSFSLMNQGPLTPLEGRAVVSAESVPVRDAEARIGDLLPEYVTTSGIPRDVAAWAKEVTRGAESDYDRAIAIQRAIEGRAMYNLNAAATPPGEDPVSYFLFTSKQGYCDLFASSMTLMARAVGLPARYVTGYYPFDLTREGQGTYILRQRDAHAWCEILFKGRGWVVFDATEGARSVDGGEVGGVNDRPFWLNPIALAVTGFVGLGSLGWWGFRRFRELVRFRNSPLYAGYLVDRAQARLRGQVASQYRAFEREIRRAARRPRGIGETISEYVDAASLRLGPVDDAARETGRAFACALYASAHMDPDVPADLRRKLDAFKKLRRGRA